MPWMRQNPFGSFYADRLRGGACFRQRERRGLAPAARTEPVTSAIGGRVVCGIFHGPAFAAKQLVPLEGRDPLQPKHRSSPCVQRAEKSCSESENAPTAETLRTSTVAQHGKLEPCVFHAPQKESCEPERDQYTASAVGQRQDARPPARDGVGFARATRGSPRPAKDP